MIASGVTDYIEVGPGNVLSKLVKRRVDKGSANIACVNDAKSLDKFLGKAKQAKE